MANHRVTQKRVGVNNKNEELKSSVPIPSNPITRQPNGTKPPWSCIGKENQGAFGHDSGDLATQIMEPNATNQNIGTITKQHDTITNVEDRMSPVKDRTGEYQSFLEHKILILIFSPIRTFINDYNNFFRLYESSFIKYIFHS